MNLSLLTSESSVIFLPLLQVIQLREKKQINGEGYEDGQMYQ